NFSPGCHRRPAPNIHLNFESSIKPLTQASSAKSMLIVNSSSSLRSRRRHRAWGVSPRKAFVDLCEPVKRAAERILPEITQCHPQRPPHMVFVVNRRKKGVLHDVYD